MFGKTTKRSDWFRGFLCAESDFKDGWKLKRINHTRKGTQIVLTKSCVKKYIYPIGQFGFGYMDYFENYLVRKLDNCN
jgi:hypothetical protein